MKSYKVTIRFNNALYIGRKTQTLENISLFTCTYYEGNDWIELYPEYGNKIIYAMSEISSIKIIPEVVTE